MIKVKFKKKNGYIIDFHITGHADFDDYGKDIVCSGVSAISQTIVQGIIEVLKVQAKFSINEGDMSLSLEKSSDKDKKRCQELLETMKLGLISMEKS